MQMIFFTEIDEKMTNQEKVPLRETDFHRSFS